MIAIVPFAVIVAAVRRAAPTNLARTGAVAGLVAGGISALAYALHCTDDSLPFVAVWYGGTIVACTLAGARLGPRLLRGGGVAPIPAVEIETATNTANARRNAALNRKN